MKLYYITRILLYIMQEILALNFGRTAWRPRRHVAFLDKLKNKPKVAFINEVKYPIGREVGVVSTLVTLCKKVIGKTAFFEGGGGVNFGFNFHYLIYKWSLESSREMT